MLTTTLDMGLRLSSVKLDFQIAEKMLIRFSLGIFSDPLRRVDFEETKKDCLKKAGDVKKCT